MRYMTCLKTAQFCSKRFAPLRRANLFYYPDILFHILREPNLLCQPQQQLFPCYSVTIFDCPESLAAGPALLSSPKSTVSAFPRVPLLYGRKHFWCVSYHQSTWVNTFPPTSFATRLDSKPRHFIVVAETLHRTDVLLHHGSHLRLIRHSHRLLEQHLNKVWATRPGIFFIFQFLLEHFIAHVYSFYSF